MLKTLELIRLQMSRLFVQNRYVFIVLVFVQTLTIFAFVFFASTIITARYEYSATLDSLRTYVIDVNAMKTRTVIDEMLTSIPTAQPEDATFYFAYPSETHFLASLFYPLTGDKAKTIDGTGITQEHIDSAEKVVVYGLSSNDESMGDESVKVGDTVTLGGVEFKVIGTRNTFSIEIPYTTALEVFELAQIRMVMPSNLSTLQKNDIVSYLQNNYQVSVTPPQSVLQKTLASLFLPFISSIFIGFFSILTFVYLQMFMLDRCKHDFSIMKLCGAKFFQSIFVICGMFIIVLTASFILGTSAYMLIYRTVNLSIFLLVYVFFATLLLLLLTPYGVYFLKQQTVTTLRR